MLDDSGLCPNLFQEAKHCACDGEKQRIKEQDVLFSDAHDDCDEGNIRRGNLSLGDTLMPPTGANEFRTAQEGEPY